MKKDSEQLDSQLVHDLNNYLYGQKITTEMCLELLRRNELAELKAALISLNNQQDEQIEFLLERVKNSLQV